MGSGSHLLFHIVSNIVPSAAWVLTYRASADYVFGMGTGVTPRRIATGNVKLCVSPPAVRLAHFATGNI